MPLCCEYVGCSENATHEVFCDPSKSNGVYSCAAHIGQWVVIIGEANNRRAVSVQPIE